MKKSVLLGIAVVVLLALPAFAGEKKIEGWQGYWTWFAQPVKDFPIKMKIPWYIEITNEEGWEILLEQVECAALGPEYSREWPCFRGYNDLQIACNFNCKVTCAVVKTYIDGNWGCWLNPADIDAPGGTTTARVKLWKADLLSMPAGETMHVADVDVYVKPR